MGTEEKQGDSFFHGGAFLQGIRADLQSLPGEKQNHQHRCIRYLVPFDKTDSRSHRKLFAMDNLF